MQRILQNLIPRCRGATTIYLVDFRVPFQKAISSRDLGESLWNGRTSKGSECQQLQSIVDSPESELILAPAILLSKKSDECKSAGQKKKRETVCKAPDLRPKEVPPYEYGYCKEPEKSLPMSCPPKAIKSKKGPCCHDSGDVGAKGGCRNK